MRNIAPGNVYYLAVKIKINYQIMNMTKVLADTSIRKKVKELLRCSDKTISLALNCHIDTELARKIRSLAIKLGGSVKNEEQVRKI